MGIADVKRGKIGIIGSGFVGSAAAYAMVMSNVGREIVLVDLDRARAEAEANDIFHAVPFANPIEIYAGDYADLAQCSVVVMTAGVNQKPDETRLQLLERNAMVFEAIVPKVLENAPDARLVVATNPVDVTTHMTARIAQRYGVPSRRVVGSGTTLDTARFRALLSRKVGVDARHIHGYVLGEHGDSEVLAWSQVTIGGMGLAEFCQRKGIRITDEDREQIEGNVRRAAYQIIEGKGATFYGIGAALARIVDVIIRDQRAIMTTCGVTEEVAGVRDVTVAMPRLVGGGGNLDVFPQPLAHNEQRALARSAGIVKEHITSLGL
ncbi:MAG: L-lactate dehydrogenase [Candidatus Nanopelagicales bacterium]